MRELSFHCPHCQQHIEAHSGYAGKELDCPNCNQPFLVPSEEAITAMRRPRPRWLVPIVIMIVGLCLLVLPRMSRGMFLFMMHIPHEGLDLAMEGELNRMIVYMAAALAVFIWGAAALAWSLVPPGKLRGLKIGLQVVSLVAISFSAIFLARVKFKSREDAEAKQREFMREINPERFEDAWQTKERLESEAEAQVGLRCSNYLGFSRIVEKMVIPEDGDVTNWRGSATVDFINKTGGMERTNLIFRFWKWDHHVLGDIDEMAMWNEQQRIAGLVENRAQ